MKKYVVCLLLVGALQLSVNAQREGMQSHVARGRNHAVSFSASVPVGRFADSHVVGAGFSYSWSDHRFGDSVNARKWIGFTAQAGVDYFIGKSETVAGYGFRYGNNLYVQVLPGVIFNPNSTSNIILSAGPSLGIYKSSSSLAYAIQLSGAYHISQHISIGPSVVYRKHAEVDALWTAGIKVGYVF